MDSGQWTEGGTRYKKVGLALSVLPAAVRILCLQLSGYWLLATGYCRLLVLKSARGADVVEVAEVIADLGVVEHSAQGAEGDAHAIGTAEAAELAAPL